MEPEVDSPHAKQSSGLAAPSQAIENAYASIATYEHHFNNMETEVRKFASAWLLASLAALAYIVRQQLSNSLVDAKLLIIIVCLMANTGLVILWILDQLVYHRLLNAVFLLGLRLEFKHSQLPPIRTLMMLFSQRRGMTRYLRFFYLIPMNGLAILAAIATIWRIVDGSTKGFSVVGILALMLVAAAIPFFTWLTTRYAEKYEEIAVGFGDPKFVEYLSKKEFAQVLAKH